MRLSPLRTPFTPTNPPALSQVDWLAKPWAQRDDPDVPWEMFTTVEADDWAYGIPPVGEWAIAPSGHFNHEYQTSFCAMMAAPKRKVVARVDSIQWAVHSNAAEAAELVNFGGMDLRIFPDAAAPGQGARPKVDVVINVSPRLAGIPVEVLSFDVDDPSALTAPLDADGPENAADDADNRPTGQGVEAGLPARPLTDDTGQIRATFTLGWMQPGNNYRIGAAIHRPELNLAKRKTQDLTGRMFFDKNGNDVQDTYDPIMDENTYVKGIRLTSMATVWRKLHVEVDSMGPVVGNVIYNMSGDVADNQNGTSTVPLFTALLSGDNNRFENGTLKDAAGRTFPIVSNTTLQVIVTNLAGGIIPQSNGNIELRDDDQQTMPQMPDTGLMASAYGAAFMLPVVDGGGNPANNKNDVEFAVNIYDATSLIAQIQKPGALESGQNRSQAFWAAYVQSGYQGPESRDGDPDTEVPIVLEGAVPYPTRIGALVYLEAIRDYASNHGLNASQLTLLTQRVVAHEIAHEFGVLDNQGPPPSIMHYTSLHDLNDPTGSSFNDSQLVTLRERQGSPGS